MEDDGTVQIATNDMAAAEKAIEIINGLTRQPQIGEEFDGVVKRIEPYGAFVEILPIRDVLNEGDEIRVRIIDIDANDRIKLSKRVILEQEARERGEEIPERSAPPPRDRGRGGRPGGRGGRRDSRGRRDNRDRRPRRDDRNRGGND